MIGERVGNEHQTSNAAEMVPHGRGERSDAVGRAKAAAAEEDVHRDYDTLYGPMAPNRQTAATKVTLPRLGVA